MNSIQNKPQKADRSGNPNNAPIYRKRLKLIAALILLSLLLASAGLIAIVEVWPSTGAQIANQTRKLVGPQAVAQVEAVVFQFQDMVKHRIHKYGVEQAQAPWSSNITPTNLATRVKIANETSHPTLQPAELSKTTTPVTDAIELQGQPQGAPVSITPSPTPYLWQISNLAPFGSLEGEGLWQPYLYDPKGNIVASRTFLQPDPERPYAIVATVAFDLTMTKLTFVLGYLEPSLPGGPKGNGLIPASDRKAGTLLATFNGGFRAANGQFGAMADGVIALPPKSDFATVGIYRDGRVRIGNWGEEIIDSPDLVSWRQNCRLIIQNGEISPRVYNNSITDWGASISNEIVTRRSALGLDYDNKTLYYFAGPSLSMPSLADAMLAAGVHQGMLLDINNFWVLFSAIHTVEDQLVAEPLLPNEMKDKVDRYLGASPDDFFYITAVESQ